MYSKVWNWVFIHQVLFLITGVNSTICCQVVTYHLGALPQTMMLSWPTYVGMLLVGLVPVKGPGNNWGNTNPRHILVCAATNIIGNICCMSGLQLVGSGIFQVLNSSVIIFTALLSKTILGKNPSRTQWMAILSIALGLAMTSHGSSQIEGELTSMLCGVAITLLGCVGYAGSYVMVDFTLCKRGSIHPQRLCLCVGAVGCLFHFLYFLSFTLPRWNSLVMAGIREHHGSEQTVVLLLAALALSSFLHNLSYFFLMRRAGAVSTGVIAGLKAIGVFTVSGVLFCRFHPAQCITPTKAVAALVVAGGVLSYSLGKKGEGKTRLKRNESELELPLYTPAKK